MNKKDLNRIISEEVKAFIDRGAYTDKTPEEIAKIQRDARKDLEEAQDRRAERGEQRLSGSGFELSKQGPDDVAPFLCYLASYLAADINGQTFLVAGGGISQLALPRQVETIFKAGRWTVDELIDTFPETIIPKAVNPAPAQQPTG